MMKNIFFFCLSLLLFSCNSHKQTNAEGLVEIDLDATGNEPPSIKETYYIPLETNDKSLIGNVDKILLRNNCFYVFDKVNMKVFIFNRNGALLDVISRIGAGPGEYVMAIDMDVDKYGNVYIGDVQTKRIIKYFAGHYDRYEIIDIGEYFLDFVIIDDENVYLGDPYKDGLFKTKLARFDVQSKKIEVLRKNEIESNRVIPRYARHYFFRSGEKIYFYERFSPVLLSIGRGEAQPTYFIKSHKHPPRNVVDEWAKNIKQIGLSDEYISDISSFHEAGEYVRLTVVTAFARTTLFNLKKSKVYNLSIINDEQLYGIKGVYASDGDYFVSCFQPEKKMIDDILSHNVQLDTEMRNKLQGIPEDSNPVIVLFNYN